MATATRAATPRTLPEARDAFVAAIKRDTPGTDLPRYVAVLDALLAWAEARAGRLAFRADNGAGDVMGFSRTGAKTVFWAVRTTRGGGPKLEIAPPAGGSLTDAQRERVTATLNAHSREPLAPGDRLRIGFGALKNVAARTEVLAVMDELLATGDPAQPAAAG